MPTLLIIPWASTPNSLMRDWKTSLVFSLSSYCQKTLSFAFILNLQNRRYATKTKVTIKWSHLNVNNFIEIGTVRRIRTFFLSVISRMHIHMCFHSIGGSDGNRTHIHRAYETPALPYLRLNHIGRSGGIRTHRLSD